MKTFTEYDKQAEKFLQDTGTKFKTEFLYNGPYWEEEADKRDIYQIILVRGEKSFSFRFGQSLANSGLMIKRNPHDKTIYGQEMIPRRFKGRKTAYSSFMLGLSEKDRVYPTPYDVLACLQKYDIGTFEDFCSEFGYDTDSRKAEKTYFAVQNEYTGIRRLFSESEMEQLQEIQ